MQMLDPNKMFVGFEWSRKAIAYALRWDVQDKRLTDDFCEEFMSAVADLCCERPLGWDDTIDESAAQCGVTRGAEVEED